jgi:hypothetical protein
MSSAQEELAALEMLRDASSDIVKHLESMNNKLDDLNKQNECK